MFIHYPFEILGGKTIVGLIHNIILALYKLPISYLRMPILCH